MYYLMIILAVILFGGSFFIDDLYQKHRGSGLQISLQFSAVSAAASLIVMLFLNGFRLEFTVFTLLMAFLSSLNGIAFTFCAFRSLGIINLSLYSLFSMLGGMVLPFLQGILFYQEEMTWAKAVCLLLIFLALLLTVKGDRPKGGGFYYAGVFVLNGMSGVLTKLFTSAPYEKTSAAGYSILGALVTILLSSVLLLWLSRKNPKQPGNASQTSGKKLFTLGLSAAGGTINRFANYLLVLALAHVHASVQYPMVTGGVIIVSTLICLLGKNKPSGKEMLAVVLAFAGMLSLALIPV